jgi:hypothetical protein
MDKTNKNKEYIKRNSAPFGAEFLATGLHPHQESNYILQ